MRDCRFIAAHRGGPLSAADHRRLAEWAAGCAERVLTALPTPPSDPRPAAAIAAARDWAAGTISVGEARTAAAAAHAAARDATGRNPAVVAAVRAAGHAAAVAHMADHCLRAADYAVRAAAARGADPDAERNRQTARLPESLRALIESARPPRRG